MTVFTSLGPGVTPDPDTKKLAKLLAKRLSADEFEELYEALVFNDEQLKRAMGNVIERRIVARGETTEPKGIK